MNIAVCSAQFWTGITSYIGSTEMDNRQFNQIIESIYQAAIQPDQWPDVLALINRFIPSTAAGLFIQNISTGVMTPIPFLGVGDEWLQSYSEHYGFVNPAFSDEDILQPGTIFTEQLFNEIHQDPDYYHNTEFYQEWMRPQDFHHTSGGVLIADGDHYVSFTQIRSAAHGQYSDREMELQTLLARHLCKAVQLSGTFEKLQYRLRNAEQLLESMGHGIIALDQHGRVLESNAVASGHIDKTAGLTIQQGRLMAVNSSDQQLLAIALNQAFAQVGAVQEIPIRLQLTGCSSLFLILMPATAQHRSQFKDLTAILIIKDVQQCRPLSVDYLQSAYRLTASEARLTQQLLNGNELKVAAIEVGISYETARGYLKSIFEKTGTRRQVDLIILMNSDPAGRFKT